ncbi:hypothetical protein [Tenacibaculum sp. nBUS_03]|uniref:hypothetical protein n=1 Tax=Tenacibaculum sp. nBUS_03 TaxID=3395320 RepID=UPI003EBEF411
MAVNVESVKAELDDYIKKNTSIISGKFYNTDVELDKYCTSLSKVHGKYPQYHNKTSRVVQGFKDVWQPLGDTQFRQKVSINFRQKVNYPLNVNDVYNTWLSDLLVEGKDPKDQPISKVIIDDLMKAVANDVNDLSIRGVYDETKASGEFGHSLDGIASVINKGRLNTKNPFYKIPLDVITDANVLDQFEFFERNIPENSQTDIDYIFCSKKMQLRYGDSITEKYGVHNDYDSSRKKETETNGYKIIGLRYLPDDIIFATTKGNLLRLIDLEKANKPSITDIQKQDYLLKIFMEFHLGYDFYVNELVYVADFSGAGKGLGNADLNQLYYPMENLK